MSADRNLLFAILAVQMDFIGRDQLIAGLNAWVLAKTKPIGTILEEKGRIIAGQPPAAGAASRCSRASPRRRCGQESRGPIVG